MSCQVGKSKCQDYFRHGAVLSLDSIPINEPHQEKICLGGVTDCPTRFKIIRSEQSQKKDRSLKFWMKEEETPVLYIQWKLRHWGPGIDPYCHQIVSLTQGYKTFFMLSSAQMRLKFILLINVKMPTIVGILTFISRINYRLWWFKSKISMY